MEQMENLKHFLFSKRTPSSPNLISQNVPVYFTIALTVSNLEPSFSVVEEISLNRIYSLRMTHNKVKARKWPAWHSAGLELRKPGRGAARRGRGTRSGGSFTSLPGFM